MFQIKGNKIVEAVENKLKVFDPQLADKNFGDGDVFYTADDVFYADLENMFDENADGLTRQDAIQLGFKLKENPHNSDNPYLYIPKDSRLKVSSISGPSGWPEVEFNGEDYMLAGDAFGIYYKEDECIESATVKESSWGEKRTHFSPKTQDKLEAISEAGKFDELKNEVCNDGDPSRVIIGFNVEFYSIAAGTDTEKAQTAKKKMFSLINKYYSKVTGAKESCKSVKEDVYDNIPQFIIEETATQFVDRLPSIILEFIKNSPLNKHYEKLSANAQQDIPYSVVEKIQDILNSDEIVK